MSDSKPVIVDPIQLRQTLESFGARLKSTQSVSALQAEFKNLLLEEQRLWGDPKNFRTGTKFANLNRYSDIIPIESTLFPAEAKQDPKYYFNANYLDAMNNPRFGNFPINFVAHQAPLPDNFGAFWRAVLSSKALGIVMVTGLVEGARKKADPYWPQKEGESYTIQNAGLTIKNCGEIDKEVCQSKGMSKTLISISAAAAPVVVTNAAVATSEQQQQQQQNGAVEEFKTVLYRFNEWPDHGVAKDAAAYRYLVEKLQEKIYSNNNNNNNNSPSPLFVHCSAGIGRTGTLIGTLIGDHMFRKGIFDAEKSPYEIVRWLKHQRVGSVQQSEQYMFIHSVLYQQMKSFLSSLSTTTSASQ